MRSRWARAGAWTAAGVLGAGLASGIGWAAASGGGNGNTHANSTAAGSQGASRNGNAGKNGKAGKRGQQLFRRLEHGELTLRAKGSTVNVDIQKGKVTDVSAASVTVRSLDGHSTSYDVTSASKVRAQGKKSSISDVKAGDRVFVIASGGDVRRLFDPKPGQPASSATG